MVSVKLISAMPSAAGRKFARSSDRSGSVIDGRPCGIGPTSETPIAFSPKNHAAAIPPATATSGAGECGHRRSMPISTTKVATATASVIIDVCGRCCTTLTTSRKKPCLVMWIPSSFGIWSSTMTSPMPALKPVSTGVGNEVSDEAQPQQPRREQHHAHQCGQRRGRRDQPRGIAVRNRQSELGAGKDRQRGGGTDAEHARGAEQRVDHHRHERGVQADFDGQSGDGRVGHRLRQHDRGRGQSGDDVEAQARAAGRRRRWRRQRCGSFEASDSWAHEGCAQNDMPTMLTTICSFDPGLNQYPPTVTRRH